MAKYKVKFQEVVTYEVEFNSEKTPTELLAIGDNGEREWFHEMDRLVPKWATGDAESFSVDDRDLIEMEADDEEVDISAEMEAADELPEPGESDDV